MFADEEKPVIRSTFQIGQSLDQMSVEELQETVADLKREIERLEQAANAKSEHLNAAAALFKR